MEIEVLPRKYLNLVKLEASLDVPRCTLLAELQLGRVFANLTEVIETAGAVLDRIRRTSGAFLGEDLQEIGRIVGELRFSPDAEHVLFGLLMERFGDDVFDRAFAVRSASAIEDTQAKSFAGLYESVLSVRGIAPLLEAVRVVWLSSWSRSVITERISLEVPDTINPMNVIIQEMVAAECAGVAFSHNPVTGADAALVEIVDGLGEALVSGAEQGRLIVFDTSDAPLDATHGDREMLGAVVSILRRAQEALGGAIDIEWAWDGRTAWLLQARPITSLVGRAASAEPVLLVADLYGDETEALEAIGNLPDFASYFREKRKRISDFARRHGLGASTALVIRLNGAALDLPDFDEAVLSAFTSDEVVLDFNAQIRQVILRRDALAAELRHLLRQPAELHTIVIRDFLRGDAGLITHMVPSGTAPAVIGEWSEEGLLGINRGTASTQMLRLSHPQARCAGLAEEATRKLYSATVAAHAEIGPVQIEWVLARETLYPLDFSVLSDKAAFSDAGDGVVVSRGYAFGPTLFVDDDRDLRLLSIAPSVSMTDIPAPDQLGQHFERLLARVRACETPPVIVTKRPLAVLATLLPHVSGFVFESAAVLSHLSILIRERDLPAVQCQQMFAFARQARSIILDVGKTVSVSAPDDVSGAQFQQTKGVHDVFSK